MALDFNIFKRAVAQQWERMQSTGLVFRTAVTGDELWATYLAAFPEGTNHIYRKRAEFDCSCCRHFIKAVGNAVAVGANGEQLETIWEASISDPTFLLVARTLNVLVHASPIVSPFLHAERTAGTDKNYERLLKPDSTVESDVKTWQHFFVNVRPELVAKRADIPSLLSEKNSAHDSLARGLREITLDSIDTVLDLIRQGSLYRGEEHKALIELFRALKVQYDVAERKELFAWVQCGQPPAALAKIRSTVIGTLLLDLSEGKELEHAVASFEAKVAPQNYKRPTALITKAMIDKAKVQIEALGLTSALDRRLATAADVPVKELLFVDRTRTVRGGGVLDELTATTSVKAKTFDKVEEIPIDKFLANVLPGAESLEVLFENRHAGSLVSLVTAADPTAQRLFKWPNQFSWSYRGELADSIKERVKQAGGSVVGDLCCRLAWNNYDDLDFHMVEPSGHHIYFATRHSASPSGGKLDVDMNVSPTTREPVENIFYASRAKMNEGIYSLRVHQFCFREADNVGFEVEMDYLGELRRFAYPKVLKQNELVEVVRFKYSHKNGVEIIESLPESEATRTEWGLKTGAFHKVRALCQSPNFWGEHSVGNRHLFFALEGCTNDGTARGFFNEFLRTELDTHRKVLEVVGAKVRAGGAEQLSGLGFSSTQRNALVCRLKGSFSRVVRVVF